MVRRDESVVLLALGGGEEGSWLHLPLDPLEDGAMGWIALVDSARPVTLLRLHASSSALDIGHPGEVPLAAETTLDELLDTLLAELGPGFVIHDVSLALEGGVRLQALGERSVRLEAERDEAFGPRLARLHGVPAARWSALLAYLRAEALTERELRVTVLELSMVLEEVRAASDRALGAGPVRLPI